MLVTKYLSNNLFYYIDPWGETLEYIAWAIRDSYHLTIMATLGKYFSGRYMIFKLTSVVYSQVITS